ncbi:MAG: hypothetical protein P8X51_12695 [Maritimibacter sp.]
MGLRLRCALGKLQTQHPILLQRNIHLAQPGPPGVEVNDRLIRLCVNTAARFDQQGANGQDFIGCYGRFLSFGRLGFSNPLRGKDMRRQISLRNPGHAASDVESFRSKRAS